MEEQTEYIYRCIKCGDEFATSNYIHEPKKGAMCTDCWNGVTKSNNYSDYKKNSTL